LFEDGELTELGLTPWSGSEVNAAVVQTDHRQYRELGPADLPGARFVYDGRGVLDPSRFEGSNVTLYVIGQGITAS
jgi:UDP-N-acetyl-D-mannosaminuronate dehydrogenase